MVRQRPAKPLSPVQIRVPPVFDKKMRWGMPAIQKIRNFFKVDFVPGFPNVKQQPTIKRPKFRMPRLISESSARYFEAKNLKNHGKDVLALSTKG